MTQLILVSWLVQRNDLFGETLGVKVRNKLLCWGSIHQMTGTTQHDAGCQSGLIGTEQLTGLPLIIDPLKKLWFVISAATQRKRRTKSENGACGKSPAIKELVSPSPGVYTEQTGRSLTKHTQHVHARTHMHTAHSGRRESEGGREREKEWERRLCLTLQRCSKNSSLAPWPPAWLSWRQNHGCYK